MKIHELNKKEALDNLNLKLSALKSALAPSQFSLTEYYPQTIRQFNLWDPKQNSAEFRARFSTIKKNANSTLNKYPELKSELIATLHAIAAEQRNRQKNSKPERISKLKSEILELQKYILLLESYTANQKIEFLRAREHYENEIIKLKGAISELKKIKENVN
ncbi:MAG: hypothetical protein ACN6O6_02140 [Pseudomonas sp.]|uniref:hypothetical protein n=1 Tax=Pseudomonas sp. TaxID=306 RepID=UPI003D1029F9